MRDHDSLDGGFEFEVDVPAHAPGEPTDVGSLLGPETAPAVEAVKPPRFESAEDGSGAA